MKRRDISNSDDVLDSRDVIARIEELEGEIETAQEELREEQAANIPGGEDHIGAPDSTCGECGLSWTDSAVSGRTPAPSARCPFEHVHEEARELAALKALADEGESSPDWTHGEVLIRESYFEDYARELAEDIGAVDKSAGWPARCIDWKQAAEELQQDYFTVDFDGVYYWIRA